MDVTNILSNCTVEGNIVKLPEGQLDRKTYLAVKKALELIGGKWKGGKVSGFVFPSDPTELLASISSGESRNLKKEYQFFATPSDLAEQLVDFAEIEAHHKVLEPSAGQGAIIKAINDVGVTPDCYELMDTNRLVLEKSDLSYTLIGEDFLQADESVLYDRIVANPPFTKNQDIQHLGLMYERLKKDGILVCITSESWVNGSYKIHKSFREWLDSVDHDVETLPKGTFKESGTNVGGKVVIVRK